MNCFLMPRTGVNRMLSEMTEAEFACYLRMDRVAARDELDRLRACADQGGENGFDPMELDPNQILLAV
jgi:hypothetical protein